MKRLLFIILALKCAWTWADTSKEVHVYQETSAGGVVTQLSDQTLMTGSQYSTLAAPNLAGFIFTHWSISRAQLFFSRDRLGRAYDYVTFTLYEETTLTANYLPDSEDADYDGIADGWEIYWYGSINIHPASDTDCDGMTFAQELEAGTNPVIANESIDGGVVCSSGCLLQYNPLNYKSNYIIRSEPEGKLFDTITDIVSPGKIITTPLCTHYKSSFAYWTLNGVRQQDRYGRALDNVSFEMTDQFAELVAVCVGDDNLREQYYWYGTPMSMMSDTDGDGVVFSQEIDSGTNPLIPNESQEGGVVGSKNESLLYNPHLYNSYTIRSEPEGMLFDTKSGFVEPGTILTSPLCSHSNSKFAYWTLNGVRQQDRHGRALDQISFSMPSEEVELVAVCIDDVNEREQLYWYGANAEMDSDSDGDGLTLAQEMTAGTNPLIANESLEGGIVSDNGEFVETDLQVYEQSQGAIVGNNYEQLFTSPIAGNAGTSVTFNNEVSPAVVDYNSDGHFDMIIASKGGIVVYRNQGYVACPDFVKLSAAEAGLSILDAAITGMHKPLLCGDGTNGVYYSDNGGRIFKYDFISRAITDMKIDGIPGVLDTADWALSASMHNDYLVHRWSFNGSLKDSVTGDYAIKSGSVTSNGEQYTLSGGSRGSSCINLGTNVLPNDGSPVTIELWATQHSVKNWSRILDFGRNNTDYICMTWTQGTALNSAATRVSSIGGDVSGLAPYSLGVEYHIALVFEPQGNGVWRVTAYKQDSITGATLDKITFTSSAEWSLALQSQDNCYLGRSFFSADYDANASYNEVRVWKKALSESELTRSAVLGPDYKFNVENQEKIASNRELIVLDSNGNLKSLSGDKTYILDTPVVDGVSIDFADVNNDGLYDLLASDITGRIWFYSRISESEFVLKHKVWGGTYEGFANGLTLAAIDWEDDGDLDCICGTAEGKLMFLRNPKVGRPTNLKALAGVDNVLLTWDPNQQSRIRGYKVYRGTGNGDLGTGNGYVALVPGEPNVSSMYTTALPRYRDFPDASTPNFSYKVSSISRFYTAGNSTPTITESPATEAVSARLGTVNFFWNDVICKLGANAEVMLSIENSMNFNVAGKTQVVSYDPTYLKPIKVVPSGLTEGVSFTESVADGKWTINLINGILPAGSGKFFTLVFETLKEGGTMVGDAKVIIEKVESIDPTVVPPWSLGDMNGDGRLTKEDSQILAQLKQSSKPKWNERELKAGDFNGNGKLDNYDWQALKTMLKDLGEHGGGK